MRSTLISTFYSTNVSRLSKAITENIIANSQKTKRRIKDEKDFKKILMHIPICNNDNTSTSYDCLGS